jgi:hypothetical protein
MDAEARLPVEQILTGGGAALIEAVSGLYDQLDRQVCAEGVRCRNCGACCHLRHFGHRLYVTTVELAYFVAGLSSPVRRPQGGVCPYQQGSSCTARAHRPVGCRLFFCEPASSDWQSRQYEALRPRLIALHERLGLPYAYVEWLAALSKLAGAARTSPERAALTYPRAGE